MAEYLEEADYPRIREAIAIALDDSQLPDETIESPLFLDEAIEEVTQRLDSDYDDLEVAQQPHAKKAAIYLCAALIAPTILSISHASTDGISYDRFNGTQRAKELRALYEQEIAEVEDEDAEVVTTSSESGMVQTIARW